MVITFGHEEVPEEGDLGLRFRQRDQLGRAILVDGAREVALLSQDLAFAADLEVGHQLREQPGGI